MSRTLKQILYGAFYLAVLAGFIYGVYLLIVLRQPASCFDNRRNQGEEEVDCGGPCAPCALKFVKDLATSTPQVLEIDASRVSLVAEVRNPNFNFGAEEFTYTFRFYDLSGQPLAEVSNISFIYPAEIKTIIEPAITLDFRRVARSEIIISGVKWRLAQEFSQPDVSVRNLNTQTSGRNIVVSGVAVNNSSAALSRAGIGAEIFNNLGFPLGASKTLLQDLEPFEQRFFSITLPLPAGGAVDAKLTKVFVEALR